MNLKIFTIILSNETSSIEVLLIFFSVIKSFASQYQKIVGVNLKELSVHIFGPAHFLSNAKNSIVLIGRDIPSHKSPWANVLKT